MDAARMPLDALDEKMRLTFLTGLTLVLSFLSARKDTSPKLPFG